MPPGKFLYNTIADGSPKQRSHVQRLMDMVMAGLTFEVWLVYLDDIVVFSKTIRRTFTAIGDGCFTASRRNRSEVEAKQMSPAAKSVVFLGHVITGDGVSADPSKTEQISRWPTSVVIP